MSNSDAEGPFDYEWDEDRGELAWNEFDWERYLREQDEAIGRYLAIYDRLGATPDRIDESARLMGWEPAEPIDESDEDRGDDENPEAYVEAEEIYTLHKNPVFIATKALCRSLTTSWQQVAADAGRVPQPLALAFLVSLGKAEDQAVQAIHALDFGDYAMAVSLFKRALSALNEALAILNDSRADRYRAMEACREFGRARLFDLREIWLRVIAECRQELERPLDE